MNIFYVAGIPYSSDELYHHGILGQKWGIRRFQNPDGTRTPAGKERYSTAKEQKKLAKKVLKNGPYSADKVLRTPQVQYAVNEVREKALELKNIHEAYESKINEFHNDKNTYGKYLNKLVDSEYEQYGKSYGMSKEKIRENILSFDSNKESVLELYLQSDEPKAKDIIKYETETYKAIDNLHDASKEYANQFLGEYGKEKLKSNKYMSANDRLTSIIVYASDKSVDGFTKKKTHTPNWL